MLYGYLEIKLKLYFFNLIFFFHLAEKGKVHFLQKQLTLIIGMRYPY